MREFKFRAWNTSLKEMASHGDLLQMSKEMSLSPSQNVILLPITQSHVKLMQHIGLKDKTGVEIYEGDILETWYKSYKDSNKEYKGDLVVVKYHTYGGFYLHYLFDWCGISNNIERLDNITNYTVIGNIFENPDLIN